MFDESRSCKYKEFENKLKNKRIPNLFKFKNINIEDYSIDNIRENNKDEINKFKTLKRSEKSNFRIKSS